MSEKRKHVAVALEAKLDALRQIDAGEPIKSVAAKLNVSEVTVGDWKRNRAKIEKWPAGSARKRMRKSDFEKTGEALFAWFSETRRREGFAISGPVLRAKALSLRCEFQEGDDDFCASVGWLERWKKRYGVRLLTNRAEKTQNSANEAIKNEIADEQSCGHEATDSEFLEVTKGDCELYDETVRSQICVKDEQCEMSGSTLMESDEWKPLKSVTHAEAKDALETALLYIEQQPDASTDDVLVIKRWRNFAMKRERDET